MESFKHTIKTRRIVGLSLKYEFLNPVLYFFDNRSMLSCIYLWWNIHLVVTT